MGAHLILIIPTQIVAKLLLVLIPIGIGLFLVPKSRQVKQVLVQGAQFFALVPLICFCVGFYDGFFGPGTGSMFIIAFHYLLKLDLVSSSANSKLFNFASNIGALIAFVLAGQVIYEIALPLVVSNILGNHFGSQLAVKNGSDFVRKVLVFSMLILFLSLAVKYAL